jgi:hypothetical protein
MRLDWHNDLACARFLFNAGKLAKSRSNRKIVHTKPVDAVQIVPFGMIEQNQKGLVESVKPWSPRTGAYYAGIWLARTG